ncbi:S-methyl-5'-thioadenosine phosphorylase-like [Symsagittifera roscoffensis]|uniref:S-methyl-5'-thioadenosine phosphorylase-like n=1 Tax=Symsagittifera roscoffensis TaxID=84072 RepID=UPI00307C2BD2
MSTTEPCYTDKLEVSVDTPFGVHSEGVVTTGLISGVPCALVARHGQKHDIMPSNVNYRAMLYALKKVGCSHVIATTACGSLREQLKPGHVVLIDDFIDRTSKRKATLYDGTTSDETKGVLHLPMDNIFNQRLRGLLGETCEELGFEYHQGGTMVTIEGPRFSTKAESRMFRLWGADLVNMSTVPEVVIANELGLLYCSVAMVTDYDCWRENEAPPSVGDILNTFKSNAHKAIELIKAVVPKIAAADWAEEKESLKQKVKDNII